MAPSCRCRITMPDIFSPKCTCHARKSTVGRSLMEAERVKQPSRHINSHGHGRRSSSANLKACAMSPQALPDVTYGSSRSPRGTEPVGSIESWDRPLHVCIFKPAFATLPARLFRAYTLDPKFKDNILGSSVRVPNRRSRPKSGSAPAPDTKF